MVCFVLWQFNKTVILCFTKLLYYFSNFFITLVSCDWTILQNIVCQCTLPTFFYACFRWFINSVCVTFLSRLDREILTCFDDVVLNCCWCCLFAINCLNAIVGLNSVYPRRSDSSVYKRECACIIWIFWIRKIHSSIGRNI